MKLLVKTLRIYRELKESIRMMNSQRSDVDDVEKVSMIEEGKK